MVLIIWLGVIGQFLGWWESNTQPEGIVESQLVNINPELPHEEKLELSLTYRDPFLGKLPLGISPPKKQMSPRKNLKKVESKELVQFPQLRYQGLVQGIQSKTAVLQINRKTYTVRAGDSIEGLHIEEIDQGRIRVRKSDSLHYIYP